MIIIKQLIPASLLSLLIAVLMKQLHITVFNSIVSVLSIVAFIIACYVHFITLIYVFIKNGKYYSSLLKHLVGFGLLLQLSYAILGICWQIFIINATNHEESLALLDSLYHVLDIFHPIYHICLCHFLAIVHIGKPVVPFMRIPKCGCIGQYLIQLGYITQDQLNEGLKMQYENCHEVDE